MPEVGWVDRSIGDCLNTSFAGEWGSEPAPGNAIVLRATDIDNDGHVVGAGAIRSIPNSKLCAKRLHQGDILLEGSGGGPDKPVGRVALFDASAHSSPAVCSNFFKTLRPAPHVVHDRFLWRKLGWFYRQPALLALQQQTTGIINLKFAEYLCVRISLPVDVAEQVKIAEVLDTLDTTIRQTEAIIDKLKQVKQGLLHDLLTRGIADNGELRPPQSEAPHLYKDSALGWIPIAWNVLGLAEMSTPSRSVLRTGPFGSSLKGEHLVDMGHPVVTIGSLGDGHFIKSELLYVSESTALALADSQLLPGDIAFSRVADVGRSVVVEEQQRGWIMSSNFMRIAVDPDLMVPHFLQRELALDYRVKRQIRATVNSAGRDVASTAILMSLRFATPPMQEQNEIVRRARAVDIKTEREESARSKFLVTRAGLMDDLLTGRVRVTSLLNAET